MGDSKLEWVCCDGGPHLLMPTELLAAWEGTAPPSNGRVVQARFRYTMEPDDPATDYDLACDVEEVLGVIPVGAGEALVLNGDTMTTWLPLPDGEGIDLIVPLEWGLLTDGVLLRASLEVPETLFRDTGLPLTIGERGATLLAACDTAEARVYPHVGIPLPPGRYSVRTADHEPDPYHLIRIHRLLRQRVPVMDGKDAHPG
jgi:hypothetical protein